MKHHEEGESLDPLLLELFHRAEQPYEAEQFLVAHVRQTQRVKYIFAVVLLVSAVVSGLMLWLTPLYDAGTLINQMLEIPLVRVEHPLAGVLSPINNVAGFILIVWRLLLFAWRRNHLQNYATAR